MPSSVPVLFDLVLFAHGSLGNPPCLGASAQFRRGGALVDIVANFLTDLEVSWVLCWYITELWLLEAEVSYNYFVSLGSKGALVQLD